MQFNINLNLSGALEQEQGDCEHEIDRDRLRSKCGSIDLDLFTKHINRGRRVRYMADVDEFGG